MKAEPQARSTFSDIGRMTDLSEIVGKCRKMSELSENVGKCRNDGRKMSENVGKCRKFDDFVGVACRGGPKKVG